MNNLKEITPDECLQGLLEMEVFMSRDFSEGSLLSCLNTLCKQRFIPVKYMVLSQKIS